MEEKQEYKTKKPKMVEVRLISADAKTALVEFDAENPTRRMIPSSELQDDKVSSEVLDMGIEYGIPWEKLLKFSITPRDFARELHRQGIWTAEDVMKNSGAVHGALQAVYGIELSTIYKIANERK